MKFMHFLKNKKLILFDQVLKEAPWRAVGWRDDDKRWELGVLDSYYSLKSLNLNLHEEKQWLDVGSGNGLNAIPLALMFPEWEGIFIEKNQKKASWLDETLEILNMKYKVLNSGVEDLIRKPKQYDIITARALFPPQKSFDIFKKLLKQGGSMILFCGKDADINPDKKFKIHMHEYQIETFREDRKLIIATKL